MSEQPPNTSGPSTCPRFDKGSLQRFVGPIAGRRVILAVRVTSLVPQRSLGSLCRPCVYPGALLGDTVRKNGAR